MPYLLYAVGLVVCGSAVSVQCYIAQWGSEEPDWFGWPGVVFGAGTAVLIYNLLGFAALAIVRRRDQSLAARVSLGGLSGVISGGAMGLLCDKSYSLPLLLFTLAQAPLVVIIINWVLGRLIQHRRL